MIYKVFMLRFAESSATMLKVSLLIGNAIYALSPKSVFGSFAVSWVVDENGGNAAKANG